MSLTPSSAQAIDQNLQVAIKATVTNDTSSKGVTWSLGLKGVGSLSTLTGASTSYIPQTATLTGAQQVTVTATSVADSTESASVQITVNPVPYMPFQTLSNGTVGVPYSQPIALTGGTAPFQWSVYNGAIQTGWSVGGSLPDGLTMNAATGMVSGTPTGAGTWYFESSATDADNEFADTPVSIQINPAGAATANAVPFLNQTLVPTSVSPGGGALTLKVTGAGFVWDATVNFNGTPLTTTFVDSEHLSALVPATDVATAKTASITVANPAPGGGASNTVYFPVGAPETALNFVNAPNSPLQVSAAFGLAIADFNEDGKPDFAIGAYSRFAVMLGKGDGTFTSAPGSPFLLPSPPYDDFATPFAGPALAAGDFNNSGHQGLAVEEYENEAAVILLGNGNGTFSTSSAAFANTPGQPVTAAAAADFNADGNLDLAFIDDEAPVALGYGKGAFNNAGTLYNTAYFPNGVAVGDFNGDGKLDAAVANGGSPKYPYSGVTVSLGNGDGTFTQANASPISLGQNLSAIVAGDFNGDGKLDLAVADQTGNAVLILLGNGNGTFQPPISIATGNGPAAMVEGDFNNDGKLDLAIANYGDGTVTLLLGNGDGTFTQASGSPWIVGKGPFAIAAADFNGDGKLDLAVTNSIDGTMSILLQH
ncbi:MAG TPA: FG-GAP-like repeat-containing protein [Acidobacteriaceae bacterium]